MTSVLQLLYILRSPVRRSQDQVAAPETDHLNLVPDLSRRRRDRHRGRRESEGDHSQHTHSGASKTRRSKRCCSHTSHREHASERPSHNASDRYYPSNSSFGGVSHSALTQLGLTRNDQLPGVVEAARKRLVERLRSVSLTENRQRILDADVLNDESAVGDGFVVNQALLNDEMPRQKSNLSILYSESAIQTQHSSSFPMVDKKIAPLSWDAFCTMKGETFSSSEGEPLTECCICLEGFEDNDRLDKLRCSHKFHHACLEPWVRSSGDCPLCRADIICQ